MKTTNMNFKVSVLLGTLQLLLATSSTSAFADVNETCLRSRLQVVDEAVLLNREFSDDGGYNEAQARGELPVHMIAVPFFKTRLCVTSQNGKTREYFGYRKGIAFRRDGYSQSTTAPKPNDTFDFLTWNESDQSYFANDPKTGRYIQHGVVQTDQNGCFDFKGLVPDCDSVSTADLGSQEHPRPQVDFAIQFVGACSSDRIFFRIRFGDRRCREQGVLTELKKQESYLEKQ